MRRYSTFHEAQPRPAKSSATRSISSKVQLDRQKPPWNRATTGCGPAPSGSRSSPTACRFGPYWERTACTDAIRRLLVDRMALAVPIRDTTRQAITANPTETMARRVWTALNPKLRSSSPMTFQMRVPHT